MKDDPHYQILKKDYDELQHKLSLLRAGLEAVIIIIDGNPELITPMKSLVETMIKIVDE